MGLATTPTCWAGPYHAFNHWRNTIAEAAGYPLGEVQGRYGPIVFVDIGEEQYTDEHIQGDRDSPPADILFVLLVHSDCEGHIHPEHAGPLADRLEGLIPAVEDTSSGDAPWEREETVASMHRFIAGLREAASTGEKVLFH
ncbi:hypothetical protein ACOALZ_01600 [Nocardiopsis algeriensis]|uniref:hypothetical protein n=1 Tax=Nocardiopsis algeriensis TaxID=1478215 RepID=UPI003B434D93